MIEVRQQRHALRARCMAPGRVRDEGEAAKDDREVSQPEAAAVPGEDVDIFRGIAARLPHCSVAVEQGCFSQDFSSLASKRPDEVTPGIPG